MEASPRRGLSPPMSRGRARTGGGMDFEQQDAPLLDDDLRNYLEQEKNNRTLKKMGYFNREDFLKFK
jgi:hypothetical protein